MWATFCKNQICSKKTIAQWAKIAQSGHTEFKRGKNTKRKVKALILPSFSAAGIS
jgi:hypothetical protein